MTSRRLLAFLVSRAAVVISHCLLLASPSSARRLFVEGGNDVYGVSIADTGHPETDSVAGYFSAWTRLDHPVTDFLGKYGFLLDLDPADRSEFEGGAASFSHGAIRSFLSATDYPLGNNPNFLELPAPGFECLPTNEWTLPSLEQVVEGGAPLGVRATWDIVNGVDDFTVELLLRSRGADMMESAVELSLRVVNRGSEPAAIGVAQLLQLVRSGLHGTGNSLRFLGFRSTSPPAEPLDRLEHEWTAPFARAWEGWVESATPYSEPDEVTYAVAGALSGPESLVPAPTPPDLIQWAQMNTFGLSFFPGFGDTCFLWEAPDPPRIITNPAALVLTWGQDEAHAIHLDPGGEVTLTQYLMAFITYPLETETFGPWEQECAGDVSEVPVRAEAQPLYPTDAEIFHEWSSPDPRVSFLDPSAAETTAFVEGLGAFPVHHRCWVGPWEAHADDEIVIIDTQPPRFERLELTPSSLWPPNHRLIDVSVDWEVSDACESAPSVRLVSATSNEPERWLPGHGAGHTERDVVGADLGTPDRQLQLRAERGGIGSGRTYTLTYEAEDAAGNVAVRSVEVRVEHDRGPTRGRRR